MPDRPRLAFAYPFEAPFIRTDLRLLETFCDVSSLRIENRKDYVRLLHEIRRAEIVFSWFALPYAVLGGAVARTTGRISVVAAGGWDVARMPEIGYGRLLTVRGSSTARAALSLAHEVLAFSDSSADLIRSVAPKSRVRTAYLGVDADYFRPARKEELVVTIANVTRENVRRKGLRDFVEAARSLPTARFVLVGRHVDDSVESLRSIAPRNVSFTGWLPSDDLRDLLSRAKAYVQPSYTEGFGVSLAEAMASGCVPVVTRRGAIPELVGEGGQFAEYGDPASLASAIGTALENGDGIRARNRILARFTLGHRLETLRRAIFGLLAQRDTRPGQPMRDAPETSRDQGC